VAVHVCTSDIILPSYNVALPSSLGSEMDDASSSKQCCYTNMQHRVFL